MEFGELGPAGCAMIVIPAFTPPGVALKMQTQTSQMLGIIDPPLVRILVFVLTIFHSRPFSLSEYKIEKFFASFLKKKRFLALP